MTGEWYDVAAVEDIEEDDVISVEIEGNEIAVFNVDGAFYATHGVCTHEFACLADGLPLDGIIECPLHNGRFDIKTGKALGAPVSIDLKTYLTKIEDGRVFVKFWQ
ncbi:non-heme iron oxygenase ferredoxin subunit (plasmid) [Pseudohalocynthiibacter aestuariivivens]|nr:non-heme iron oxygenase ferredoxin subunit [Pseudohalocynthiibacter aestuariivivens]QIE48191.1 non-heme iron oxygenase ferredoxin subunit [Pseudohalocynthiibacter aestuariivivens]